MTTRGYVIWLTPMFVFGAVLLAMPGIQPWWFTVPVAFGLSVIFRRIGEKQA